MKPFHSPILIPFLIIAITATTLLFSGTRPAHAVLGVGDVTATIETVSIPQIFFNSIIKAVEAGAYTVIKKAMRQGLANLTKSTLNNLLQGGKGKGELFETEPWEQFWQQAGDEASGAALEGFVQGFQNEYEAQTKKSEALKNLEDKETATLQPQIENASKLADNVRKLEDEETVECMTNSASQDCTDARAASVTARTASATASAALKTNTDNTFTVQKRDLLVKRTSIEKAQSAARKKYDECKTDHKDDVGGVGTQCDTEQAAITAQDTALDDNQKGLNDALAGADKATAAQLKAIDKGANKKDADLITGQQGALTDAGKSLINLVCKPTPDIALSFLLPLGDRIELSQRKAICPYSELKKNWQSIYNNTGTQLNELSLTNWRTLAGLTNPNTSDLGAAYSVSIAGYSVSDAAKMLGVTQYMDTAVAGGLKTATEYNGKKTSPVSSSVARLQSTIAAGVQEDTRLVPTGHLLADLVVTGLGTIINTSFAILQDGLKKKTAAVRQPKQNRGIAALSQFQQNNALYFPDADPNAGSHQFAEARLASFDALELSPAQNWDVLNKITGVGSNPTCYNPIGSDEQKATDVESCTIDEKFNEAIRNGLTVQEAVEQGLLNGDGVFGFDITSKDEKIEPAFERNFPYHSLVILRKYRVVPVSWELTALYIQKLKDGSCNLGEPSVTINCSLKFLMSQFNISGSKFYHLIDPNWVLMVPPTKCMLEGYGPQSIHEVQTEFCPGTVDGSGNCKDSTGNTIQKEKRIDIVRAKTCVDYQTCLAQDAAGHCIDSKDHGDGTAKGYGYCLQEQRISQFTGNECKPRDEGCQIFQDTQTKQSTPYIKLSLIKNADLSNGECTEDNAGCRWLSAAKQFQMNSGKFALDADKQAKTAVVEIGAAAPKVKTQQEWSSAPESRVYLASKAEKCLPEAEGCREVSGVDGMSHLRLAPASYECDKDGIDPYENTIPWYKRVDCKQFTGTCKLDYVGCEQYTPANDIFSLTGISPDDSAATTNPYTYRCPAQCANIISYSEQKTLFDTGLQTTPSIASIFFSVDTARKCSIADVGCEEFTNVNVATAGGEGKEYYTYLQRCEEKKSEDVPAEQVFLTFEGSDTAGGQPVKQYVVGTTVALGAGAGAWEAAKAGDWQPKCADATKDCDCSAVTAERQKYDPRIGTILCKEFINASGNSFYRYTDNLIYYTQDCMPYRRTLDDDSATNKLYSSGLSKQCSSPSAVNCREYHAPTAGNIHVVSYDNFEDGTVGEWTNVGGTNQEIIPTAESEVLGDRSLKIQKKAGTPVVLFAAKNISFKKTTPYTISFNIKGEKDGSFIILVGTDHVTSYTAASKTLTGNWQHVQYSIDRTVLTADATRLILLITKPNSASAISAVLIDDIIIKEVDGIEYVIKDSWEKNGMCFGPVDPAADPKVPDFTKPAYLGCQLYSDRQGGQHAIRSFSKVCPLEMAGCVEAKIKDGAVFDRSYDFESSVAPFTSIVGSCTRLEKATNEKNGGAASGKVTLLGSIAAKGTTASASDCAVSGWDSLNPNHYYGINASISTGLPIGGRTLTGSVWVKADNGKKLSLLMQATDWGSGGSTSKTITANGLWQLISLSWNVPARHTTSTLAMRLSFDEQGTANTVLYWDDARLLQETGGGKTTYIIPDPSKQCAAQDNKCTAYGSPKLLTKADGAEQLKTVRNLTQDTTRNEWIEKEDWNIAYYKVTPEEAKVAQDQFKNGDTSPYNTGICREAKYTGSTMTDSGDIGCREYLAGSNGDKTYFRNPGNSVCQPPKEGQTKGYYYTCNNDDTVVCRKDDDCPVKDDKPGTCNTQKELQDKCPVLPDTDDSTGVCSNDKNKACNATNVAMVCGANTTCLPTPFVQSCQAKDAGCRKIVDPECVSIGKCVKNTVPISCTIDSQCDTNTKCNFSDVLRTDYGRDTASAGITCKRDYYFTDNLQERADVCERSGGINVNAGCLLFNDQSKEKWEYQIVSTGGTSDSFNPINDEFKTTPPTYCTCDVSATREDDCTSPHDASPLAPDFCYNRYTQIAANTGPLLRKYKHVRTDTIYNSTALYNCAEASGEGKTNLTKSIDLTKCSATVQGGGVNDANTLIKVKPDRSCKTWLACTGYFYSGGEQICTERTPCNKANADGTCANRLDTTAEYLQSPLKDDSTKSARKSILSLSGYARPDYRFIDGDKQTEGGHDSFLNKWGAYVLQPDQLNPLPFNKIISFNLSAFGASKTTQVTDGPYINYCTIATTKACKNDTDCGAGEGICGLGYLRSCRLYAQQNSPRTAEKIINACEASGGSNGIEGFCLEPNPRFRDEYLLSSPKYTTCLRDYNEPHPSCDANTGPLSYRYYENYCLNWLPVRPGINQSYIAGSAEALDTHTIQGPVYGCIDTETYDKDDAVQDTTVADAPSYRVTPAASLGEYSMTAKAGDPGSLTPGSNPPLFQTGTIDINGSTGLPYEAMDTVQIRFDSSNPLKVADDWLEEEIIKDAQGDAPYNAYYIAFDPDSDTHTLSGACPSGWTGLPGVSEECIYDIITSPGGWTGSGTTATFNPPTTARVTQSCTSPTSSLLATSTYISTQCSYKFTREFLAHVITRNSGDIFTDNSVMCRDGNSYVAFKTDIAADGLLSKARWVACNKKDIGFTDNQIKSFKVAVDIALNSYEPSSITTQTQRKYDRCKAFVKVIDNAPNNAQILLYTHAPLNPAFLAKLLKEPLSAEILMGDRYRQHTVITYPAWAKKLGATDKDSYNTPTGAYAEGAGPYPVKKVDSNENVETANTNNLKWYFAKPYSFATWNGSGNAGTGYTENFDISTNPLVDISNWWPDARGRVAQAHKPTIYGKDKTKHNQFIFVPAGDLGVIISFFADVHNDQLPLMKWGVYKVSNGAKIIESEHGETRAVDGIGLKEKEPPVNASDPNKPFGPVYFEYEKSSSAVQPLNNKNICVEVKDNWEACTRICGRITQIVGSKAEIKDADFKVANCGAAY